MYKLDMRVHIIAFKLAPLHKEVIANLNLNTFALHLQPPVVCMQAVSPDGYPM